MEVVVEYKGTSRSKFTFTIAEVRIKLEAPLQAFEDKFIERAKCLHRLLIAAGWTGITLRGKAGLLGPITLRDSYKNRLATIRGDEVVWWATTKEIHNE